MESLENCLLENENYIKGIANKYFPKYQYKEDLYQVGSLGFIKAYQNFDENIGCKLTSYAFPYIIGEMKKLVREDKNIKISKDISKLYANIERISNYLTQKNMQPPSIKQLSDYIGVSEYYISEAIKAMASVQSIDEDVNNNGKVVTLHDIIPNKGNMDLDDLIALKAELESLTPFEKSIIETRYLKNYTQSEVAKNFNMTQVQVSRQEQKVIKKLRNNLIA